MKITGEVYFEVAHDAAKSFIVKTSGQDVTVLGTHFNINAYDDETLVKTTLMEGSIQLTGKNFKTVLQPGQQAQVSKDGNINIRRDEDLEQAIAWKNGMFKLASAPLPEVLRQVSRWYDVEIIYNGEIPSGHLTGKVSRNLNLSEIVKLFEYSGFNIKMDGRKMIVQR